MERLKRTLSDQLFDEAKQLVPGGVIGIRKPENFIPGEYPTFIDHGYKGHIVDVDGNDYIDMLCSYGPIIIGHAEKEVDDAVIEQMKKGYCFNLTQTWQNKLARSFIDCIPCAEQCFFVKTGSDATTSAIRLARAYTGKLKILRCGYHGWHNWCCAVKNGIPEKYYEDTHAFVYNDIASLERLIEEHRGNIAAIITTPIGHELNQPVEEPKNGFLEAVRDIATKEKAVLVFDEIRTGFRMSIGGAQQRYNVTPDLAVFGKAMANGYPISAVCGKRDIIETMNNIFISSTFFPNSLEMVAAHKTIEILKRDNMLDAVEKKGLAYLKGVQAALDRTGAKAELSGPPQMPFLTFPKDDENKTYRERRILFYTETIRRGVFLQPFHHGYIAYRHTDEDIQKAIDVVGQALQIVADTYPAS